MKLKFVGNRKMRVHTGSSFLLIGPDSEEKIIDFPEAVANHKLSAEEELWEPVEEPAPKKTTKKTPEKGGKKGGDS